MANKIKISKVKIIDIKDYSIQNHNTTIVNIIWKTALKGTITIEEKYGKEKLVWDDFEWGMINGKYQHLDGFQARLGLFRYITAAAKIPRLKKVSRL